MHEESVKQDELDTVSYYDKNIQSYIERTFQVEMKENYERFLCHLPPKAKILDAGCGPGRDALAFSQKGYSVLGFDASEEMVKYVNETLQIPAIKGFFNELEFSEEFDGIWASASLVHVPPSSLADVLHRFWKALKPNGVLCFSYKEGSGVQKEQERTFTYMNKETIAPYLHEFTLLDQWSRTPKAGVNLTPCSWLNTIVRKKTGAINE